jgi:4-aminobutyrate aminotransferase-like enzyme
LMTILKKYGIAVFVDEIQTFGRTENAFAFQTFGLDEFVDIVSVGKMSQVCATLFVDDYQWKPGLISQTFTGATASIFAANAILTELECGDYFGPAGRNMQIHQNFANRFDAINKRHPGMISGPYGYGLMIAFTAFDGSLDITKKIIHGLFKNGVIAFVAAKDPYRIRFLPPAAVTRDEDINKVCEILEQTLIDISESRGEE